jgi:hypothetical protein
VIPKQEEKWKNLCALASVEKDPQRLMDLVVEINRLLEEKEQSMKVAQRSSGPGAY